MLVECEDCKNPVSVKASACPKCGAPISSLNQEKGGTDQKTLDGDAIKGLLLLAIIAIGSVWFFFFKSSLELSDQKVIYNIIFDREISFTATNSGPAKEYSYYVSIGDDFLERLGSPKYCEGKFNIGRDETKKIRVSCPDLNFTFSDYSISVK